MNFLGLNRFLTKKKVHSSFRNQATLKTVKAKRLKFDPHVNFLLYYIQNTSDRQIVSLKCL